MKPVEFSERNAVLKPPIGWDTEKFGGCLDLPVWRDGQMTLSCWKMSFMERLKTLVFGRIWLYVMGGETQPAVNLYAGKSPFLSK